MKKKRKKNEDNNKKKKKKQKITRELEEGATDAHDVLLASAPLSTVAAVMLQQVAGGVVDAALSSQMKNTELHYTTCLHNGLRRNFAERRESSACDQIIRQQVRRCWRFVK